MSSFINNPNDYGFIFYTSIFLLFISLYELKKKIKLNLKKEYILNILISSSIIVIIDYKSYLVLLFSSLLTFTFCKLKIKLSNILIYVTGTLIFLLVLTKYLLKIIPNEPIILIGFSFYFFRLISFIIESGRRNSHYLNVNIFEFLNYSFFLPLFFAGPIQRFHDFKKIRKEINNVKIYLIIFFLILAKIIIVDEIIEKQIIQSEFLSNLIVYNKFYFFYFNGFSNLFKGYLDLLIYTEISINLSKVMGYKITNNFNKPLLARNISEFWNRWHISLSSWVKDYINFPIFILTHSSIFSIFLSMFIIAIWHEVNLNWVLWGLSHSIALSLHHYYSKLNLSNFFYNHKKLTLIYKLLCNFTTISFVALVYNLVYNTANYNLVWQLFIS